MAVFFLVLIQSLYQMKTSFLMSFDVTTGEPVRWRAHIIR
jgi:hypothetical protein